MIKENKDAAWPVLVSIGETAAAALMNRKAYQKSRETGVPWIVHPTTLRILPWPGEPRIISLSEGPGCFRLLLNGDAPPEPYGAGLPPETNPHARESLGPAPSDSRHGDVMDRLSALIAERRQTMPEGSYTTHLFKAGPEKIRKKTGEEAVELLLAQSKEDLVYEAADLIYHLLVLLEASGLSWSGVLVEMDRRHGE